VQVVSAYYSALGTVYAKWRKEPWRVYLLGLLWWYRAHAIHYLDQVMQGLSSPMLEATDITPDSIDVLATVVWRLERRSHVATVKKLLQWRSNNPELKSHTHAFMLMHEMRFGLCRIHDERLRRVFLLGHETALRASKQSGEEARAAYGQASRVMRHLSEFLSPHAPCYKLCLRRARQYAEAGKVSDQLLKLS